MINQSEISISVINQPELSITLVLNCVMGLGGLLLSDLLSLLTWTLTQGSQWAPTYIT